MLQCSKCDKEFKSYRGLNAHQISHKEGDRYSVSRKGAGPKSTKEKKHYGCKNCNKLNEHSSRKRNKFCSVACQQEYQWKKTKEEIESGIVKKFRQMRRYLIEKDYKCQWCGISDIYNGKPITLQCDHIDGDSDNNKLDNLRLLCPNCHSQTETWGFKNRNHNDLKETTRRKYYRERYLTLGP